MRVIAWQTGTQEVTLNPPLVAKLVAKFTAKDLTQHLADWLTAPINWLIPKRCISCQQPVPDSCQNSCCNDCYMALPFQENCCNRCGQAFGGAASAAASGVCGRCLSSPPSFDACFCAFRYAPPIDTNIQQFKYSERPELARSLAQLMATEILATGLEMPELLIPTPMHIARLRRRGYNQAALLARALGQILGLEARQDILRKHRLTAPQVELSLKARRRNVRGSFEIQQQPTVKHVAIVDDVLTTGSTAAEMSKVLKQNGVDYIQVWALAHTM